MRERALEKQLDFKASPERVWSAIAEVGELSKWFGHRTELEPTPGADGAMIRDEELGELTRLLGVS